MIYFNAFAESEIIPLVVELPEGGFYPMLQKGGTRWFGGVWTTRLKAQGNLWRLIAKRHKSPLLMIGEL